MAANKYIVQEGQNIYDIAVQEYGDLEQLFTIFVKNPEININTDLTALQELNIDAVVSFSDLIAWEGSTQLGTCGCIISIELRGGDGAGWVVVVRLVAVVRYKT